MQELEGLSPVREWQSEAVEDDSDWPWGTEEQASKEDMRKVQETPRYYKNPKCCPASLALNQTPATLHPCFWVQELLLKRSHKVFAATRWTSLRGSPELTCDGRKHHNHCRGSVSKLTMTDIVLILL